MSSSGRAKGEQRSAKRDGDRVDAAGRAKVRLRNAKREGPPPTTHVASTLAAPEYGVWAAVRYATLRDLKLALRSRTELGVQLLFYVLVVSLFPLASSPDRLLLATMAPGVLWVAALLAALLSLPRLFASDFNDGSLEQFAMSPYPLPALVSGKMLAHWLTTGLPMAVLSPLLALQYGLDSSLVLVVTLSLLIGTPILSLMGGIGAGLTLGARGGGSLLALLVLPLFVPVLIFGAGAADAIRAGLSASANFSLLGAGLLISVVGAPLAAAAAVRIALD